MPWHELAERKDIMLCQPFEEKRFNKWGRRGVLGRKLDGERCRIMFNSPNEPVQLLSSSATEIVSVPHLNKILEELKYKEYLHNKELDGELYVHGWTWEEIHSVVSRTVNFHEDFAKMQFHLFEEISINYQAVRINKTLDLFPRLACEEIKLVEPYFVEGMDNLMRMYEGFIDDGYEGFVLRHPMMPYLRRKCVWWMKFKPKQMDVYRAVRVYEEIDKYGVPKGRAGGFTCVDEDRNVFNVGSGLSDPQRDLYWSLRHELFTSEPIFCHVKYQHKTAKSGVPRFGTFKLLTNSKGEEVI